MTNKFKLILSILPCFLLVGCSEKIRVETFVDKRVVSGGFSDEKEFYVCFEDNNVASLAFSQKIEKALRGKGFVVTKDSSAANFLLSFSSDIKEKKVMMDKLSYESGKSKGKMGMFFFIPYAEESYSSGRLKSVQKEVIVYPKTLSLTVYTKDAFGKKRNVWNGTAKTVDECPDITTGLDFLLIALFKHFGMETKQTKIISRKSLKKDVAALNDEHKVPFRKVRKRVVSKEGRKKRGRKREKKSWVSSSYLPKRKK